MALGIVTAGNASERGHQGEEHKAQILLRTIFESVMCLC